MFRTVPGGEKRIKSQNMVRRQPLPDAKDQHTRDPEIVYVPVGYSLRLQLCLDNVEGTCCNACDETATRTSYSGKLPRSD